MRYTSIVAPTVVGGSGRALRDLLGPFTRRRRTGASPRRLHDPDRETTPRNDGYRRMMYALLSITCECFSEYFPDGISVCRPGPAGYCHFHSHRSKSSRSFLRVSDFDRLKSSKRPAILWDQSAGPVFGCVNKLSHVSKTFPLQMTFFGRQPAEIVGGSSGSPHPTTVRVRLCRALQNPTEEWSSGKPNSFAGTLSRRGLGSGPFPVSPS